jgi:hypothetical protein
MVLSWAHDGALYIRDMKRSPVAHIFRLDPKTGRRELWRELGPPEMSGVVGVGNIALAVDGKAYAYNYSRQLSDLYVVAGLE